MRILNVQQGSWEWHQARLGIPTASRFDCIITPKTRKPSAQSDKYMRELLAERLVGHPVNEFTTDLMERGKELEPQAALAYELLTGRNTTKVGLILTDDGRVGASLDRLVGTDMRGALEIKCLSIANHVAAMLDPEGTAQEHFPQCQGQMLVASRLNWVDLMFYNPELPSVIWRFVRDHDYLMALDRALDSFNDKLDETEQRVRAQHGIAGPHEPGPAAPGVVAIKTDGTVAACSGDDATGMEAGATDGATVTVVRPLSDIEKAYQHLQPHEQ